MKHQTAIQARPLPNRLADRGRALLPGLLAALLATALPSALLTVGGCGASFEFGGGVGGSGLVYGPMGDDPSCAGLLVNEVCFDTTSAAITVNGDTTATVDDLEPGMVLAVEGQLNDAGDAGTADSVAYDSLLTGTVENVDVVTFVVQVLGDTLLLDKSSRLVDFTLSTDSEGLNVDVSGFVDDGGLIRVTRIARRPTSSVELSTSGELRLLDPGQQTFRVRGLLIDYSSAVITGAGGLPANGLLAAVTLAGPPSDGAATAERVRLVKPLRDQAEGQAVVLRGLVTSVTKVGLEIELDRVHTVVFNDSTEFIGTRPDEVDIGQRLRVKGRVRKDGKVRAISVEKLPEPLPFEPELAPLP